MDMISIRRKLMAKMQSGGGLPDEYQQVAYLESTGTQYIDTGIVPYKTKTEAKYQYLEWTSSDSVICGSYAVNNRYYAINKNNENLVCVMTRLNTRIYGYRVDNNIHTTIYNDADNRVFNDGVLVATSSLLDLQNATVGRSISLFARHAVTVEAFATARLYYIRFTDNIDGSVIGDFVPCYRKSDNKPGMYDLVTNTFFTNAGTGEFQLP